MPQRPFWTGKGGLARGWPRFPSIERDERRLLAADKGACAELYLDIEIEALAEDILAEESALLCLLDREMEPFHGKRVLRPDVDIAVWRTDGIGADDHALDHRMGISFDDRPVHERARVSFVGIADKVLYRTRAP